MSGPTENLDSFRRLLQALAHMRAAKLAHLSRIIEVHACLPKFWPSHTHCSLPLPTESLLLPNCTQGIAYMRAVELAQSPQRLDVSMPLFLSLLCEHFKQLSASRINAFLFSFLRRSRIRARSSSRWPCAIKRSRLTRKRSRGSPTGKE